MFTVRDILKTEHHDFSFEIRRFSSLLWRRRRIIIVFYSVLAGSERFIDLRVEHSIPCSRYIMILFMVLRDFLKFFKYTCTCCISVYILEWDFRLSSEPTTKIELQIKWMISIFFFVKNVQKLGSYQKTYTLTGYVIKSEVNSNLGGKIRKFFKNRFWKPQFNIYIIFTKYLIHSVAQIRLPFRCDAVQSEFN